MPEYGVNVVVRYDTTNLTTSHGVGGAVIDSVTCTMPPCGDGIRQVGEKCDGNDGLPPGGEVTCRPPLTANQCNYDFSEVTQFYCDGACSLGGQPNCDQFEANVFCRLKTGNPSSTATVFSTAAPLDEPGFDCAALASGINLGVMQEYGVLSTVRYNPVSVARTHPGASAAAVIDGVLCTDP
jgi:hypothetical protein